MAKDDMKANVPRNIFFTNFGYHFEEVVHCYPISFFLFSLLTLVIMYLVFYSTFEDDLSKLWKDVRKERQQTTTFELQPVAPKQIPTSETETETETSPPTEYYFDIKKEHIPKFLSYLLIFGIFYTLPFIFWYGLLILLKIDKKDSVKESQPLSLFKEIIDRTPNSTTASWDITTSHLNDMLYEGKKWPTKYMMWDGKECHAWFINQTSSVNVPLVDEFLVSI